MDRARDQLLAGSRFAKDQNVRVRTSRLAHQLKHLVERTAAADDVLKAEDSAELFPQMKVFQLQPPSGKCAFDRNLELIDRKRLGEIVESARFHRGYRGLDRRVRSQ